MLLLLMSPQFFETAVSIPSIVWAADPEAVIPNAQVHRIPMTLNVSEASEGFGAADPWALGAMLNRIGHRRQHEWGVGAGLKRWLNPRFRETRLVNKSWIATALVVAEAIGSGVVEDL